MACHLKKTCKLLAIIVILGGALPSHADSNKDDFNGLFEYFSKEEQKARNQGIILEQTRGRQKGTGTTFSLFGKSVDPLPDSFNRSNYRGRDWTNEKPTTILNLRVDF